MRRKFDEDEHDEIGRPEGPGYGDETSDRERTAPPPPVAIEPAWTDEPEPEHDWDRPVPASDDDEESEDMPEIDVPASYAEQEPLPPDEPPTSRTVEPAPPATTESQSFGRRPRRPGGR
jgi:hypothetical protein